MVKAFAAGVAIAVAGLLMAYWLWPSSATSPRARVIFLGDSLTRRGDWDSLLGTGRVANHGVDGDVSKGALRRLSRLLEPPPAKVFIMIGINELGQARPDSAQVKNLLDNHARMIAMLKEQAPQAKVFILSLLPVSSSMIGDWIGNQTIIEANQRLMVLASRHGCVYLDLHSRMKDQRGDLDRRYTDDGLHLSPAGYQVWRDLVSPHIQ